MKVTFIIANPAPFVVVQEPVRHRSVTIELSEEQIKKLNLHEVGLDRGEPIMEHVSQCFIEEE